MPDPQVEPAAMMHRNDSLRDKFIHNRTAVLPFSRQDKQSATLTELTPVVTLLQVAQHDWGELLLSQRSHLVKDAAQGSNAIVERSKEKVRMTPFKPNFSPLTKHTVEISSRSL